MSSVITCTLVRSFVHMSYAYLLVLTTADYQPLNIYTLMRVQIHIYKWTSQLNKKILKDFLLVLSSHWWKGHDSYYHTSQLIHLHPNLFLIRLNVWCFWARFSPIVAKYFGGNEYTLLFCNDGNRIGDILIFPLKELFWYLDIDIHLSGLPAPGDNHNFPNCWLPQQT